MKKIILILTVAALSSLSLQAQNDPIVIEVDGQKIRQSEFMKEFNANVGNQLAEKKGVTETEKRLALEEYAELYALFRAKERDALAQGFDTMARLRKELNQYRKELAAPYLTDSTVMERLLAEAYERNHTSLRAAHLLIPVQKDATPDDTLRAYNYIMALRKRIVEDGEDFHAVTSEVLHRFNPQAPSRPEEGDLGYFSVFNMVYPFENAAYALKVGEVSMPVRTQYGYHLIKLLDRVEGLYGEVTMAHIWLHSKDSNERALDINKIYQQLQNGVSFERLARQSDDRTTAEEGGVLANATLTQLPPEYIHAIVNMKEGEFSKPFFTQYGWHIVKLIKRDTLPPLKNLEGYYKQKMTRDQRGTASRTTFAADCRRKYGIVDCTTTPVEQPKATKAKKGKKKASAEPVKMMATLDYLIAHVSDSVITGQWRFKDSIFKDTTPLVITPAKRYTALDVAHYIKKNQKRINVVAIDYYVRGKYTEFLDSVSIDYADSQLENENEEFAELVNEYRRGLMIFNYNDRMIWSAALRDTAGFVQFYNRESRTKNLNNPDDSIYFFHPRARVTMLSVANSDALAAEKARQVVEKARLKSKGSSEMKALLMKNINRKKYPSDDLVEVSVDLVEQTRQKLLEANQWQEGTYIQPQQKGYRIVAVEEILPRSLKDLRSARGYYLNGYQNELEKRLNEQLKAKYNVKIHRDVLRTISY